MFKIGLLPMLGMLLVAVGCGQQEPPKVQQPLQVAKGNTPDNNPGTQPPVGQPPVGQPPVNQPPVKAPPKSLAGNIRARANATERMNDLKQIGIFYNQSYLEFNKAPRSAQDFAEYCKTAGPIYTAIKDGTYRINTKGPIQGPTIVAFEWEQEGPGHLAVRLDGSVEMVTPAELKAAGLIP
jgi:hypothetical protein